MKVTNNNNFLFRSLWAGLSSTLVILAGCGSTLPQTSDELSVLGEIPIYTGLKGVDEEIPRDRVNSLPRILSQDGIQALAAGNLVAANLAFNRGLMFGPSNSHLQWLNGVTYHLRALQGETAQFAMAREAYELAIRFDASSWIAHYQLGLLFRDMNEYAGAQNAFAEALLFRPDDPDLLYQMLWTSYYNYDPETARATLNQLTRLEPDSERTLRAAPIIMAALGDQAAADQGVDRYASLGVDSRSADELSRRVGDWERLYEYYNSAAVAKAAVETVSQAEIPESAPDATNPVDEIQEPATATNRDPANQMVIVDVAIIESEEDLGTRKGVNLLDGLRVQYGLDRVTTKTRRRASSNIVGDPNIVTDVYTRTLIEAISIPRLDYSLNIFNSAIFTNEVLARPTLVALNGHSSRFFSGSNVRAAATASSTIGAVSGGEAVNIDEDIGIDLIITPTFIDDDLVRIDVDVTRTFLESPNIAIDFEFKIQTSKTHVSASIVMAFGETLILSGLSEKETETFRDGVPGLQDIPILQYLFSEKRTLDFQRSVLVLITPRRPFSFSSDDEAAAFLDNPDAPDALIQFGRRYRAWFQPAPHWVSVVQHLEKSGLLYREFRTGDLEFEIWSQSQAFRKRFGDVVEFLYY
ncbi:MAG: hypothetical protein ACU0B1_14820 [Thermohalobaculum sp.]